ncbi:MAG: 4-(cytidine 5'-diphospho)-2-C-methyl-D-erythritol kinase, partial [Candidatus Acidiferrales bacterium]
ARQAGLSGSGSTVFALFSRRAAAQRAAERLAEAGRVFLVQTLSGQAYRRALGLWLP